MAVIAYRFRDASVIRGDPAAIAGRIEALKGRNKDDLFPDGFVTPGEVLEDAIDPASPLHPHFTWDRTAAARKWNLFEAKNLIRCYEITITEPDRAPVVIEPANVHIRVPGVGSRFVTSSFAMSHETHRAQVLADALQQVEGARKRLAAIQGITPEIIDLFARLIDLIGRERKSPARRKAGAKSC